MGNISRHIPFTEQINDSSEVTNCDSEIGINHLIDSLIKGKHLDYSNKLIEMYQKSTSFTKSA